MTEFSTTAIVSLYQSIRDTTPLTATFAGGQSKPFGVFLTQKRHSDARYSIILSARASDNLLTTIIALFVMPPNGNRGI
jgi:hypothetical protein